MDRADGKQGYKVLVVDDEDHIRRILKFQLEKHRLSRGARGERGDRPRARASRGARPRHPRSHDAEGRRIRNVPAHRQNFQTAQIPIIMLTAKSELPDKIKGLQDGANDYLIKPYSNEELLLRVGTSSTGASSKRRRTAHGPARKPRDREGASGPYRDGALAFLYPISIISSRTTIITDTRRGTRRSCSSRTS